MTSELMVYLDGKELKELDLRMVMGHEHPMLPDLQNIFISIPNRQGVYDYGSSLEPLYITLPLRIRKETKTDLQLVVENLKKVLLDYTGKPRLFKLSFGYEMDRYYLVRVANGIPFERVIKGYGRFDLSLVAPDPRAFSSVKNSEITWGSEIITFNSGYHFGHAGTGNKTFTGPGNTVVTVAGASIRPIITVTGKGQNVSIGWDGKSLGLGTVDGTVIVDLHEFVVLRDGEYALHTIKGDWLNMYLSPGETTIEVTGNGLDLSINFDFQDRFF